MDERRCGTCRFWGVPDIGTAFAMCSWKPPRAPFWYRHHPRAVRTRPFGGKDCGTWEARDAG